MTSPSKRPRDSIGAAQEDLAPTTVAVQQALERLRQERETFDQRKRQDARWFQLRMTMGGLAVIIIPAMIIICFVLLTDAHQPSSVKSLAASALLIDILGLVIAVWKVVLNPASITALSPVTDVGPEAKAIILNEQVQPSAENE